MKLTIVIFSLLLTFNAFGQKPAEILATATGHTFTERDLSPEAQDARANLPALIADARKQLLAQMVGGILLETEAKARNLTVAAVINAETAKIKDPTEAEIKAVYDANQEKLGDKTLDAVRKQIVEFLRQEPEDKAIKAYVDTLAVKYKVVYGKDVNSPALKPLDLLFTMTGRMVSAKEFDDKSKLTLYDLQAGFFDELKGDLEDAIYDALVADDAEAQKLNPGDLIAREVTSKMRDYSNAEREGLETGFRTRLFTKYAVKILLKEPVPVVQNISVDDDPSRGPLVAPVTVVMFSDFQCSACSATHPILTKVMAEYPGRIRFVVRDFPLESIHENAFRAACAAGAANAQRKFFEYTEILYKNQTALDTKSLSKYAADLGLNVKQFELDLSLEKMAAEIRKDMDDGNAYGVNSTPTIFVNGVKVRDLSAEGFRKAINRALRR